MRTFLAVAMLSLALVSQGGCSSCRQMMGGWFNHGDRCNPYPQSDCQPGGPRAQMMYPGTTTVLPGTIEVAPQ